ncbi:BatA domain-containing protein, partial [bacterium]|nr:BatA domain-containing protein [bacterium]
MPLFVNPLALWGLLLAGVPIVIHLLNRRRFTVRDWAAMEFLLASQRKNFRRVRIEQLILLALRTLMIIVLVLLVARPLARRRVLAGLAQQQRFVCLVFDTSFSMGYRDGSLTSYDRALAYAQHLMGSLREGDSWALVAATGRGRVVAREPSFDLDAARGAVSAERLPLSDAGGSIADALEAVEDILEGAPNPRKEVVLVTDLQRVAWLEEDGRPAPDDVERARRIAAKADVTLVDVGAAAPTNLAVADLRAASSPAVAGAETTLRLRVGNYGPNTAAGVTASLLVDGFRQQTTLPQDISPGGSAQWELRHVLRAAGQHEMTVELQADNLPRDDRRFLALEARQSIRVLCVDGEPGADAFTGETDYLRNALRPGGGDAPPSEEAVAAAERLSLFDPERVAVDALTPSRLPRYDIVVLANVPRLDAEPAAAIARYVRDGGSLLVCLGDRIDPAFYNGTLHAEGKGPLPCRIGDVVATGSDGQRAARISAELGDHPFLALFREQKTVKLTSPSFFRYHRLDDVDGRQDARVVCRFEGGDPAIVEAAYGRGRVVVVASSIDDEWNDMPSWPAYLALVQEICTQVARDPDAQRNVTVGQPLLAHLPPHLYCKTVGLLPPGVERPVPLAVSAADGLVGVTYAHTDRA